MARERRTLVCVDESAFTLLPACVATWAPRGQTPVLRASARRDHLPTPPRWGGVISGITPAGKLYQQTLDHAVRGPDAVRFLWHLLRHIAGPVTVIWDGLPAHRGQVVRAFLSSAYGKRVHLERLPAYAPELNPDEGVWQHLKRVALANVCCQNLAELKKALRRAMLRLRQKSELIRSFFRQCGFSLE